MNDQPTTNETPQYKKLYISAENKKLAGVCGGIAEYFKIDPTLVRLGWIVATLTTGIVPGIIAYIAAIVMLPKPHVAAELNSLEATHA